MFSKYVTAIITLTEKALSMYEMLTSFQVFCRLFFPIYIMFLVVFV